MSKKNSFGRFAVVSSYGRSGDSEKTHSKTESIVRVAEDRQHLATGDRRQMDHRYLSGERIESVSQNKLNVFSNVKHIFIFQRMISYIYIFTAVSVLAFLFIIVVFETTAAEAFDRARDTRLLLFLLIVKHL